MTQKPITVGLAIPAWRAEAFIAETLQSALAQTGVEVRVFVGVDDADAATAERCTAFADSRIDISVRDQRLGWVGNSNATLEEAILSGVDYVAILPHDDLLLPDYCARLVSEIARNPGTALAFSDIQNFGRNTNVMSRGDVLGSRIERFEQLLRGPMKAIPYRGLMPRDIAAKALPLPSNTFGDYAVDTVWMYRQAAWGEMRRVAEPLYRKRYHDRNTHDQWALWDRARRFDAYLEHCRDCKREVMAFPFAAPEYERLWAALEHHVMRAKKTFDTLTDGEEARLADTVRQLTSGEPCLIP